MLHPVRRPAALLAVLTSVLLATTALAQPKEAATDEEIPVTYTYTVDHDQLTATSSEGASKVVGLPCIGVGMLVDTGRIYVACGERGAVVLSLGDPATPKVIDRRDMGGTVTGFFKVDGKVWAQLIKVEAQPVEQGLKPSPIVGTTPAPETPEPVEDPEKTPELPVGEVVKVGNGEAVINIGTKDGLTRGQKIELFIQTEEDLGDGEKAVREELAAVSKITAISEGRAVVKLGLGERVPVGAMARPTEKKITNRRLAPPRVGGVWEAAFNLRPFLALDTFGFGMVSDGSIGMRTEGGLHLMALIEPMGLGFAEEGNIVALAASAVAAYDSDLFEVGLGLGFSAINDSVEDDVFLGATDDSGGIDARFERVRSALSIVQTIRLGAIDGLHLKAHNTFLFYKDEFHYGGTNAQLQIPVSDTSWLILGGGGGSAGYGYGEVGLRVLLMGNGDAGSLFITPRLGGAGLFGEVDGELNEGGFCEGFEDSNGDCVKEIDYGGPMMGIGAEYRF